MTRVGSQRHSKKKILQSVFRVKIPLNLSVNLHSCLRAFRTEYSLTGGHAQLLIYSDLSTATNFGMMRFPIQANAVNKFNTHGTVHRSMINSNNQRDAA